MTIGRGWPLVSMITTFSGGTDPQRDLRRREVLARPVPAIVVGQADVALLGQECEQVVRVGTPVTGRRG